MPPKRPSSSVKAHSSTGRRSGTPSSSNRRRHSSRRRLRPSLPCCRRGARGGQDSIRTQCPQHSGYAGEYLCRTPRAGGLAGRPPGALQPRPDPGQPRRPGRGGAGVPRRPRARPRVRRGPRLARPRRAAHRHPRGGRRPLPPRPGARPRDTRRRAGGSRPPPRCAAWSSRPCGAARRFRAEAEACRRVAAASGKSLRRRIMGRRPDEIARTPLRAPKPERRRDPRSSRGGDGTSGALRA